MTHHRGLLFHLKTIAFLVIFTWLAIQDTFAQVPDTVYQKPELNTGMPPAVVTPPVIVMPPTAPAKDTVKVKVKEKVKTAKEPTEDNPLGKKYITGGSFGISFGTYTYINAAPILGYRLTDRITVGTGLSYFYINDPYFEGSLLGGKLFAQGMVYKTFFGHAEYELVDFRNNFSVILAGAGYRQMFSERAGLDLMVLFDLNQNGRSFYRNPVIRPVLIFNL
ncbi:hypothetical protein [Adhaeribacter terreus]|uniref:Outer membrane protein beta-barrel domain-containing protein n=1 Tax=Adhaeribacter terreus TaxID=529703 RepID=A0ABW0EA45_9BACT